jgi:hypothetical protein
MDTWVGLQTAFPFAAEDSMQPPDIVVIDAKKRRSFVSLKNKFKLYDNYFTSIINIYFYETFSTSKTF